jgi:hypothetical protein
MGTNPQKTPTQTNHGRVNLILFFIFSTLMCDVLQNTDEFVSPHRQEDDPGAKGKDPEK